MVAELFPALDTPLYPPIEIVPERTPSLSELELRLLDITTVEKSNASGPGAISHESYQVQKLDISEISEPGSVHRRLYSAPADQDNSPPFRIVNILGWTESIDAPHVRKHHAFLSEMHPEIPVSTEATYGIDGTGGDLGLVQKLRLSHDAVAERMYMVMKHIYPDLPIITVATSQGASVLARMRALNDADGNPLDIKDQLLYEPYLLTKEQDCRRILGRFIGGHVFLDGARELLTHTRPTEIPGILWDQVHSMPHTRADLPALIGHGISNLRRTEQSLISGMLANGALIVQGDKDCLGCEGTNSLPGVELKVVQGKGHSMGMHPLKRAHAISSALRSRGHL